MNVIVTTPEALQLVVQDAVAAALSAHTAPARPNPLLTPSEAAERLNVSTATVKRWTVDGRLPKQQYGRVVRYRSADVEAVLSAVK